MAKLIVDAKNGLNLRKAPSGEVIKILKYGEKLTALDEGNDDWIKVKAGRVTGYVMRHYVRASDKDA